MEIPFLKYQGTGNDFVIIDNRQSIFSKNDTKLVAAMCDRKFGIGADGLILLENHASVDFKMVYYNSDGNLSSMCGNGGRCIVKFAASLEIISKKTTFEAVDGLHEASIDEGMVSLKMNDVSEISVKENSIFLDTGSPHHVEMVEDLESFDVFKKGRKIRNEIYGKAGANVNFVQQIDDAKFAVRTYERGVENETLSCGTGVTAVALAMHETGKSDSEESVIETPGGTLKVQFQKTENGYQNIYLIGPVEEVFRGTWRI